jgi:NAD(P)-dependent dehydrogenase (short-subunit alcohol dehydrogenase family)
VSVVDVQPADWIPAGSDIRGRVASVADESAIEGLFEELGAPDVVVNNAGIVRFGPLVTAALEDFRAVVDVNLIGTFVVARAAARRWITAGRPGCIVNVTSMNGAAAGPNAGAYGPSKAAIALLTSQMALEWGAHGIRVNAVAPGLIATPMTDRLRSDRKLGVFADAYPSALDRPGRPEEIAALISFLLSDQASLLVGSVVFADGGTDALLHPLKPEGMDVPKLVLGAMDAVSSAVTRVKAMRRK